MGSFWGQCKASERAARPHPHPWATGCVGLVVQRGKGALHHGVNRGFVTDVAQGERQRAKQQQRSKELKNITKS